MSYTIYIVLIGVIELIIICYITYALIKTAKAKKVPLAMKQEIEWLSVSREQFRKLFEEAPIAYFILDQKGDIQVLNKAGLRFFGAVPEEIISKNLFSFVAEEDSQYAGYLETCTERQIPVSNKEVRVAQKNKSIRWVQLSILALSNSGSKDPSSIATIIDITDEKNLDNAKTEFVSLASHQLRAPLATIKWYIEMMLHPETGTLNPKQEEYMKTMGVVNLEMIDLVDTLLNVSRIEIGKLSIDMAPTNVQTIVESIISELAPQIEKKQMKIVKQFDGTFTDVQSDAKLLRIVIHNLMTNAIKYTPEGGTVTVSFVEEGGSRKIVVSDTGYGIPRDEQDKIFTKLFRATNVKEIGSSQSTGLGLYMIKSIVESMGGTIGFISEQNRGSSFTVTL